jgi:hypothetical protein
MSTLSKTIEYIECYSIESLPLLLDKRGVRAAQEIPITLIMDVSFEQFFVYLEPQKHSNSSTATVALLAKAIPLR